VDDLEGRRAEHDATWDCIAARRLGARALALRTGGFSREELRGAGAEEVYDSLPELGAALLQR